MRYYSHDVEAFSVGTQSLSLEEIGAYILLLGYLYHEDGVLKASDPQLLARILRCDIRVANRVVQRLLECGKFDLEDSYLVNARANATIAKTLRKSELARTAAKKRWKINGHAHANGHADAMPSTMPIENREERKGKNAREARWPFDEFWELYPHKIGKGAAEKAFRRVERSGEVEFPVLMAALLTYCRKTDDRPWCNPATWLNQQRWLDIPSGKSKREGWRGAIL